MSEIRELLNEETQGGEALLTQAHNEPASVRSI